MTKELLYELFDYNDGFLIWKISFNQVKIGSKAGTIHKLKDGPRRVVGIKRKTYLHSRLVYLYHHGELPAFIDHRDRDKLNDKIENLREATRNENNRNKTSQKNSSSQYLGVSFHKRGKVWMARIRKGTKLLHLGSFKNEIYAALAYNEAAKIHHGEFANLNIIIKLKNC